MASQSGKNTAGRTGRGGNLKRFYWNKQLHRVLRINRPANLVDAWNFPEHKRVSLLLTDYRLHAKPAFLGSEVAKIFGMTKRSLDRAWQEGNINEPDKDYPLSDPNSDRYKRWWGEHHIWEAHEYFMNVHIGRPRLDGEITPRQNLPSAAELKAKLGGGPVVYVKDSNGNFQPLWEPPKF